MSLSEILVAEKLETGNDGMEMEMGEMERLELGFLAKGRTQHLLSSHNFIWQNTMMQLTVFWLVIHGISTNNGVLCII